MSRRLWHCSSLLQNLVERLAPFERSCIRLGQNGLQDARDVVKTDLLAHQVLRSAQGEILHQQQIDFVAIGVRSCRPSSAADGSARAGFLRWRSRYPKASWRIWYAIVFPSIVASHFSRPSKTRAWASRAASSPRRKEAAPDRIAWRAPRRADRPAAPPATAKRIRPVPALLRCRVRAGNAQSRHAGCFWAHGLMIQFPTSPTKRAATALRPSWYRTATTVARVSSDPSELSRRT